MKIAVINGPNINLTGSREVSIYGDMTYGEIVGFVTAEAAGQDAEVLFFQSNHEGAIIDRIHECLTDGTDGVIINPGAYAHYSRAIADALACLSVPCVEVHISNIHAREEFRSHSVTAGACRGIISGFGAYGYVMAVNALLEAKI